MIASNPKRPGSTNQADISGLKRLSMAAAIALVTAVVACGRAPSQRVALDIATTTSVQNSGLLEALLPHFTGATVRVHAAGSGRSLEMLNDGIVELVISHAPQTERRYLADHPEWTYRKLASNRFVLVGPANDPAHIRETRSVVDAFRRVAAAPVDFVSRGDGSGTHEREQMLWTLAGVTPPPARLLVSGRSMAITLRQAHEKQAYTLTDEATFWQLQRQIDLVTLLAGDDLLLNTYALVFPRASEAAAQFADWLTRGDGRQRIADHRIEGRVAFHVWPESCPDTEPDDLPCT